MPNFRIFTESNADIKLLTDYIAERFAIDLTVNAFDTLNSWSGYRGKDNKPIASIQENFDQGFDTILILDADKDFAVRQAEVITDFKNYDIPVHLFLFPNNATNGNLETLLTSIAVDRKIIECFQSYEQCVRDYNLPLDKARIYSYLDALLPSTDKIRKNDLRIEQNRNYQNADHWNLHHDYLQPLHDFLSPFFI